MRSYPPPKRARHGRLWVEQLEPRHLLSGFEPTATEQLLLEQLNDIRANPAAYGASIQLDLSAVAPAAPLAFDPVLIQAARQHAQDMNDRFYFSHITPEGVDPGERLTQLGFPWTFWGESSAAGSQYSTTASALEALIVDGPTLQHRDQLLAIDAMSRMQDEVGIGIVQGGSGPLVNYYTIDTASTSDPRPFLAGVVFNDTAGSGHYAVGEGIGQVAISVSGPSTFTTLTWGSGGYSLQLDPGTYTVTASGGLLTAAVTQTVTIGTTNVRLNFALSSATVQSGPGAWVGLLYHDLLGRTPSAGEIAGWTGQLENGVSPAAVGSAFLGSWEYAQDLVTQWYQTYLHRSPDAAGLSWFSSALQNGGSEDSVREAILGSDEYASLHGGTADGLVQALYGDVLGRGPAGSEADFWIALTSSTGNRAQVVDGIVTSVEATNLEVSGLYAKFLRRNVDASGLTTFSSFLSNGGDPRVAVEMIISSPEYSRSAPAIHWLIGLYQDVLGRSGDSVGEVGSWLSVLNSGVDRTSLATTFANSTEAQGRIVTALYERLLNRPPDPASLNSLIQLLQTGSQVSDIVNRIVSSPEFYSIQGNNAASFATALYRDLLQRLPLSSEKSLIVSQLSSGQTRLQIAASITSSGAYEQNYVTGLFQLYMHRPATTVEMSQFISLLANSHSDAAVIGALLGSDEYYALFAG